MLEDEMRFHYEKTTAALTSAREGYSGGSGSVSREGGDDGKSHIE